MDLATFTWILVGWMLISVVVSLAVGRLFRHSGISEDALEHAAERKEVVRYLRTRHKPAAPQKTAKVRAAAL